MPTGTKLSQIAPAGAPPATTDVVVGVTSPFATPTDNLFTVAQLAAAIPDPVFSSVAPGDVPASGGGSSNFIRADGVWAVPPGGSGMAIGNPIGGGAGTNEVLFDAAGPVLAEASKFTISSGNPNISNSKSASGAYLCAGSNAIQGDPANTNWFFGSDFNAFASMTSGSQNTGCGERALTGITTGFGNVAVGFFAGLNISSGQNNVAIGINAMQLQTTGSEGVAIGDNAAGNNVSGGNYVAIGHGALSQSIAIGGGNMAIGPGALGGGTATGANNIAIGPSALTSLTTGSANSASGSNALQSCTSGNNNSAEGQQALQNCTTGINNTGIGPQALQLLVDGSNNVGLGFATGSSNLHGSSNLFIGHACGTSSSGSSLLAIGESALLNCAGDNNIGIGPFSGEDISTGTNNLLIGVQRSPGTANVTTGSFNVSIGYQTFCPDPTASNQLNISSFIFGKNMSGANGSISPGAIGLGITVPTASLHITASTTTQANIRLDPTSAAGPTAPNDGDLWYDGTHLNFRIGAVTHVIV